ncbi:aminotransferase class I/II-fold pyridoxal phosphate-dependent enzyme [Aliikangiella sp. IMCC44653]
MNQWLKLDFNERSDYPSQLALDTANASELWAYPERAELEAILAEINQLKASQVLATNGGDEAIMLLMRIIKETARLILPLPAFSQYTWGLESWNLKATQVAAKADLNIDVEANIEANNCQQGAVTIITSPNNPTGEQLSQRDIERIIKASKQNGGWVFLDEAYIEFSEAGSDAKRLLNQFDNLVILRTLSKAYGLAGIRLGYLLGEKSLISLFKQRCMPFNIPQPSLQIANAALTAENRKEVIAYCRAIRKNREALCEWLRQHKIKFVESQANFVLLQLPPLQAAAVKSFLNKNQVLVRSFSEESLSHCLRITLPYQIDRLIELLKQALTPGLICFDMDGVLIDTSNSYDTCVLETVATFTDKAVTRDEVFELRNSGGFNNDWVLAQALLASKGVSIDLAQVTETFQKLYLGENNNGLAANETALINSTLVTSLLCKQQTQFAVVTGRPRTEAAIGQALVGLSELPCISLDDVDLPKPSPEGINKLQCQYSNLSWMCGDNPDDMQAANASNSLAIGIGVENAEALYQAGADIVLENINQLEEWLCPLN